MTILLFLITAMPFLSTWLMLQTLLPKEPDGDTHNGVDSPETGLIGGSIQENKVKTALTPPATEKRWMKGADDGLTSRDKYDT